MARQAPPPLKRRKVDEDEDCDGRCGCRAQPQADFDRDRLAALARLQRRALGLSTPADRAWEADEAARLQRAADVGYLGKQPPVVSHNCGAGCLNALLLVECDESNCSVGAELCNNRHFTRGEGEGLVEPFPTELKGWGLRAKVELPAERFLIEYVGEVINNAECRRRIEKEDARVRRQVERLKKLGEKTGKKVRNGRGKKKGQGQGKEEAGAGEAEAAVGALESNYYFMSVCDDVIIDAGVKGSVARFVNHSCRPNCLIAKWTVQGELRIALFTQRPVAKGEELTIDYKYDRIGLEYQACYCGADNCAKWIGGRRGTWRGRGRGQGRGRRGRRRRRSCRRRR